MLLYLAGCLPVALMSGACVSMFAFMAACGVDDALGSCLFGAVDACSASIIFAVAGLVLVTVDAPCLGLNHVSPIHAGPSMSLVLFWVVSLKLSMTSAVGLPGCLMMVFL